MSFYSQRQLALKMTTLYCFQKSINKGNTQVNGSLLKFTYFCSNSCPCSCQCVLFIQCKMQISISKYRPLTLYRDSEKKKIISLANQNYSTRQWSTVRPERRFALLARGLKLELLFRKTVQFRQRF